MWRQRAVIIHRDEATGYGLTVFGDNPVSVQTIKKGKSAVVEGKRQRSGVRPYYDYVVKKLGWLVLRNYKA